VFQKRQQNKKGALGQQFVNFLLTSLKYLFIYSFAVNCILVSAASPTFIQFVFFKIWSVWMPQLLSQRVHRERVESKSQPR
jgi:hypothetical protein